MNRTFLITLLLLHSSLVIFVGCKDTPTPNTDSESNNKENIDSDADINAGMASDAGIVCGKVECKSDLSAAKAALIEGNYQAAWAQYRCGDTVEAAAGAALTKLATIVEGEAVTNLLADLGIDTPFSAKDVMGQGGLLYQLGQYYDGSCDIRIAGGITDAIQINSRIHLDDYQYESGDAPVIIIGSDVDADADLDADVMPEPERLPTYIISANQESRVFDPSVRIELEPALPLNAGDIIELSYNCNENYFEQDPLLAQLYIDISAYDDENDSYCYINDYATLETCPTAVGAIEVISMGEVGEMVEFKFTDVPINCTGNESEHYTTTFSGTVASTLKKNNDFDIDGMHPIFNDPDEVFSQIPTTLTANQLIAHAAPLIAEFEEAACYADKADNGSKGSVFVFPSALTGRSAIPLLTRDTKMLSALYYASAAVLNMIGSYNVPLRIGAMDEMTDSELVKEVNTNMGTLKTNHQMAEAGVQIRLAMKKAIAAVASKENDGLFPSNKYTLPGEMVLDDYLTFGLASLSGTTPLPHTVPALNINLSALFSSPPDPSQINSDMLVLEEDLEWEETYVEAVEVFFQELLSEIVPGFSYDMEDYEYGDEGEKLEENGEEFIYAVCRYLGC